MKSTLRPNRTFSCENIREGLAPAVTLRQVLENIEMQSEALAEGNSMLVRTDAEYQFKGDVSSDMLAKSSSIPVINRLEAGIAFVNEESIESFATKFGFAASDALSEASASE